MNIPTDLWTSDDVWTRHFVILERAPAEKKAASRFKMLSQPTGALWRSVPDPSAAGLSPGSEQSDERASDGFRSSSQNIKPCVTKSGGTRTVGMKYAAPSDPGSMPTPNRP